MTWCGASVRRIAPDSERASFAAIVAREAAAIRTLKSGPTVRRGGPSAALENAAAVFSRD